MFDLSPITNIIIGTNVTTIGAGAFLGCTSLASVAIPGSVTNIGSRAFGNCDSLGSVLFTGGAPTVGSFVFNSTPVTIYYLPNTTGWHSPFAGRPAVCWNPSVSPTSSPCFSSGKFAFTLAGNANIPVCIETCDSLTSGVWSPVTVATLNASGTLDFSDPDSASRPSRFYRITFPQ